MTTQVPLPQMNTHSLPPLKKKFQNSPSHHVMILKSKIPGPDNSSFSNLWTNKKCNYPSPNIFSISIHEVKQKTATKTLIWKWETSFRPTMLWRPPTLRAGRPKPLLWQQTSFALSTLWTSNQNQRSGRIVILEPKPLAQWLFLFATDCDCLPSCYPWFNCTPPSLCPSVWPSTPNP